MSLVRSLHLVAWVTIAIAAPAQTAAPQAVGTRTPPAQETTAELIKVSSEIRQLEKLSSSTAAADRWRILWLHQHIYEQVMAASLQVDAIIGGAVGATSSGLQLSSSLTKPAAGVGIGAGTLSAGLALAGVRQERGRSSNFDFDSNMLAEFFDRPTLPNSRYPATIWIFLNQTSPNGPAGLTREQQLLQTWVQVKRIDSLSSTDKINRLTSEPSQNLNLSIDDFEDRGAMLQDVRARISYLKRDLGTLLASLPTVNVEP
jgi:hypothetical protein